jgi:hypothetical protein
MASCRPHTQGPVQIRAGEPCGGRAVGAAGVPAAGLDAVDGLRGGAWRDPLAGQSGR